MSDATIYQLTIPGDFGPVTLCISTDGRAIQAAARREVASYGRPETDLRVTAWRGGQPRETWMALAADWLVGDHDSGTGAGDSSQPGPLFKIGDRVVVRPEFRKRYLVDSAAARGEVMTVHPPSSIVSSGQVQIGPHPLAYAYAYELELVPCDADTSADVGDEADITSAATRTVRDVAREGGVEPRHVKICFRERFGDVQPVEVRVQMRASGGRGHKAWAEGFGSGVWEAAAMAFAEVESRKAANWIVGDGDR